MTFLVILLLVALGVGLVAFAGPGALGLMLAVFVYFLPSIVGSQKRNAGAIFALNLLLGWTLIGWIVAFVWAVTRDAPAPTAT